MTGAEPFGQVVEALRVRLAGTLPGHAAHGRMAPFPSRAAVETLSTDLNEGRPAATLVLLFPGDAPGAADPGAAPSGEVAAARFVLTERHATMRTHAGQISLPGGALEPGETPEVAARREAWEEVGVDPATPEVLGRLTPLYIPPSKFSVWPIVAAVSVRPAFQAQEAEVASLFDAPLSALLDPDSRRTSRRAAPLGDFDVPHYALGGREVWGATAMMLSELAEVIRP